MSCISLASAVKPQFASDNALNKRSVVIDYSMSLDLCGLCLFSLAYHAMLQFSLLCFVVLPLCSQKSNFPHIFFGFFHQRYTDKYNSHRNSTKAAKLSLRKDELALNSILVKVKNFALALCSMLGQGGQQLLKVVGHLTILVGKRPTASSNF